MRDGVTALPPTHADQRLWDKRAHAAVRDLNDPSPAIFWADLLCSATAGWVGLAVAVRHPVTSPTFLLGVIVAILGLYRALCFMHELTHVKPRSLPGFQTAWNLVVGAPLLMPSFIYTHGVHQSHHTLATYGTPDDPEYLPFASCHVMTTTFVLHSVLIPFVLMLRFLVVAPVALAWPALHRFLVERASALAMHGRFRREATPELLRTTRNWTLVILAIWGGAVVLAVRGVVPWRAFAVWYGVMACVSVINVLRTLGAHHYESDGVAMDRTGQLLDSIETPGAWWTETWAPVGLRYHALHHYFPGIPYHHLPEAHRRLVALLPPDGAFSRTLSPSLGSSLGNLLRTGWSRSHAPK